jgi:hypothetical protein
MFKGKTFLSFWTTEKSLKFIKTNWATIWVDTSNLQKKKKND